MSTPTRNGRPPEIDAPLTNGNTAASQIIQSIAAGNYFEQASDAAGVGRMTARRWLRDGAKVSKRLAAGATTLDDLTEHEQACYRFWAGVTEADARWEVSALTLLQILSQGATRNPETGRWSGPSKTVVTTKQRGDEIETTTRTEYLPPDASIIMWRLERRHPDRFGKRVEIVGGAVPDPLSRDDRVAAIGDTFAEYLAALDAAQVDAANAAAGTDDVDSVS